MKHIKKIIIMGVALIMCLGIFSGCESAQEAQIREDYLAFVHSQGETEMTLDDVKILKNYGNYNKTAVVLIGRPAYQMLTSIEIDGVTFKLSNSNAPIVWKDGNFFELEDAYNQGVLSKKNLKVLAKKVNRHQGW